MATVTARPPKQAVMTASFGDMISDMAGIASKFAPKDVRPLTKPPHNQISARIRDNAIPYTPALRKKISGCKMVMLVFFLSKARIPLFWAALSIL